MLCSACPVKILAMNSSGIQRKRLLAAIFLEFPVPVVKRTDLARLEPPRNTVKVKSVLSGWASGSDAILGISGSHQEQGTYVANAPCDGAFFARRGRLIRLALYA